MFENQLVLGIGGVPGTGCDRSVAGLSSVLSPLAADPAQPLRLDLVGERPLIWTAARNGP
jgi:hypothetical protein